MPFGEFIPTGFRWFTEMMNIPLGDFNRGAADARRRSSSRGERIAPNICYEDLFGEELAARFADAAQAPTIFANLSNIGWFGDTIAVDQHLQHLAHALARVPAADAARHQHRRHRGHRPPRPRHRTRCRRSRAASLDGEVEGRSGLTPFARWAGALRALAAGGARRCAIAARASRRAAPTP